MRRLGLADLGLNLAGIPQYAIFVSAVAAHLSYLEAQGQARVELDEVERVLEKAPGVAACHVVERDERLAAFVVPEHPDRWREAEVRAYLAQRLHTGMLPATFSLGDRLPLTDTGKAGAAGATGMAGAVGVSVAVGALAITTVLAPVVVRRGT